MLVVAALAGLFVLADGPTEPPWIAARRTLASSASAEPPTAVAGISPALTAARTALTIGPATGFAIASGLASTATGPVTQVPGGQELLVSINDTLAAVAQQVGDLSGEGVSVVDQMETALAPLAAGNPVTNAMIDATADALDRLADQFSAQLQPFDRTLHAEADIVRSFRAG